MTKNGRFLVGLVGVAAVVTYLMWTGVQDAAVYYYTPTELMGRISSDPSFAGMGVKVSGRVVPGTHQSTDGDLFHRFEVMDLEDPGTRFAVEYRDILPDTFSEDSEVVVEGRFRQDGVFEATTVLTKCGSRYEAAEEDLAT